MTKLFKRAMSGVLTVAIMFTTVALTTLTSSAAAATASPWDLTVTVKNEAGKAIEDAEVTLYNAKTGGYLASDSTASDGVATIPTMLRSDGMYVYAVTARGYTGVAKRIEKPNANVNDTEIKLVEGENVPFYIYSGDIYGGSEVWINGGKTTDKVGNTSISNVNDSKTINLYADVEAQDVFNGSNSATSITKGITFAIIDDSKEVVGTVSEAKPVSAASTVLKVSGAKATAGKDPSKINYNSDGTIKNIEPTCVGAYVAEKRADKKTYYTLIGKMYITTHYAPAKVSVTSKQVKTNTQTLEKADVVSKGIGNLNAVSQRYFVYSGKDATELGKADPYTNYTVSVDPKSKGLIGFVKVSDANFNSDGTIKNLSKVNADGSIPTNSDGTPVHEYDTSIRLNNLKQAGSDGFLVVGLKVTADTKNTDANKKADKPAKANIIITNNQTGKATKMSIEIGNNISSVVTPAYGDELFYDQGGTYSDGVKFGISDKNVYSDGTKLTTVGSDGILFALSTNAKEATKGALDFTFDVTKFNASKQVTDTTFKDSDGTAIANPNSIKYTVTTKPVIGVITTKDNKAPTVAQLVDSKGKVAFKHADFGKSDFKIKAVDKANKVFTVTAGKKNYEKPYASWIVIAYGNTANQIVTIPVVAYTPDATLTKAKFETEIASPKLAVFSSGVVTTATVNEVKLTKSATKGIAVTLTTANGVVATKDMVTVSTGGSFDGKKLTLTKDNAIVTMTVTYGRNKYVFLVSGKDSAPISGTTVEVTISGVSSDGTIAVKQLNIGTASDGTKAVAGATIARVSGDTTGTKFTLTASLIAETDYFLVVTDSKAAANTFEGTFKTTAVGKTGKIEKSTATLAKK